AQVGEVVVALGGEFDAFLDAVQGQHEARLSDGDLEAIDDGECQRQPHGNPRAEAFLAVDADRATQGGDVAFDDIHPDATAGKVGDLFGRRESRLENKGENLTVGQ